MYAPRQTCRKGSEYNIAAYPSHILNNGIILNMCMPHISLFQIGVTFFEYAAWLYSGMSAVPEISQSFRKGKDGATNAKTMKTRNMEHAPL
jgi:hypothetical protein